MNKYTKQYYHQIKHLFPILGKEEKHFLFYLKEHLTEYETTHQEYQYNDYVKYYGYPEDIVSAYYEHIESEYIVKHMKSRKIIKRASFLFILLILALILYIVFMEFLTYQEMKTSEVYYETYTIEE